MLFNLLPAVARLHPFFKPGGKGEATFLYMDVSNFDRRHGVGGFLRSLVTAAASLVDVPLSELLPPDASMPGSSATYSAELEAMHRLYARLPRTKTHFFLVDEVCGARTMAPASFFLNSPVSVPSMFRLARPQQLLCEPSTNRYVA